VQESKQRAKSVKAKLLAKRQGKAGNQSAGKDWAPTVTEERRRLQEHRADVTFSVSGLSEAECSAAVSAAEDVPALFSAINSLGVLTLNAESATSAVAVTASVEVVVTSGTVGDSTAFDQALEATLADPDGLRAAVNAAGGSLASVDSAALVSLDACVDGREIPGSDRTAENPCPALLPGEACNYQCTNGARPSGEHVCRPDGTFLGGGCGRRPTPACPSAWEQMDVSLACDSEMTLATDPGQPTAEGSERGYWARLQYWTECGGDVALANVLCTAPTTNGVACELSALPIGDTEVEIQAWDPVGQSDAHCRVVIHVVDEEPPVIAPGSCPAIVTTQAQAGTLAGHTPTTLELMPTIKAQDNSNHVAIRAMVGGQDVTSPDFPGFRSGAEAVEFVAEDPYGNTDRCFSTVGLW